MKKTTIRSAGISFAKEWLLPALGKAYAVFVLAEILVAYAPKVNESSAVFDQMIAIINGVGDRYHLAAIAVVGLLLVVIELIKVWAAFKPPLRFWFKLSRLGGWVSAALGMIAGTILLPMTLWLAAALEYNALPWHANPEMRKFALAVIAYVGVNFAIYWKTLDDKNSATGAMIWTLKTTKNGNTQNACSALDRHFEALCWLGEAEVSCTSDDGHVVIELPLVYPIEKWPAKDKEAFLAAYESRANALKDSGFTAAGVSLSPAVREFVAGERKRKAKKKRR